MAKKLKSSQNYAIVIGGWHFNGLGVVRSLGEAGIPSVFISFSDFASCDGSRYCLKKYFVHEMSELVPCIREIVKEFGGRPALFPTGDGFALELDRHYDELKDITFCPGCGGKIAHFMDKDVMSSLAEKAGFPVPKSQTVLIQENGAQAIRDFGLPIIIKPLSGLEGAKADIHVCKTEEELETAIQYFEKYSRVLVQTYVHGEQNLMVEFIGCKTAHKPVEVYGQLEKIREYPVDRGSTSYAVMKSEITYIDVKALDALLDEIGFSGVFDLEMKVVDGRPYFIEINLRNGAPGYAYTKAGFNAPAVWVKQQCGEEVSSASVREIHLMAEGLDFSHVIDRNIGIFSWLRNFFKAKAHMILNHKDLGPVFKSYKLLAPFIKARLHGG